MNKITKVVIAMVTLTMIILPCVFAGGKTEQKAAAAKPVTLRFWTPLTTSADKEIHQKLIDAFKVESPNITIVAEYVSHKDWTAKWMTAISSGDYPELTILDQTKVSWLYYQNMLEPVEDLVKEFDPNKTEFPYGKSDIPSCTTPDGHIWAIPYSVNINALWYRKDLLSKAGVAGKDIKKWDDLYATAKKVANPPDIYGIGMALARELGAQQQMFIWLNANGGNLFDPKTGAYLLGQPETRKKLKEALQWLKKLYDNEILPPGVANWMWGDYRTAMAKGKLVFTASWAGDVGITRDQNPAMLDNLAVTAHPSGPSAGFYPPYHDAGAWAWSISKAKDENIKNAAKTWLRFFFKPDNVALATTARPVYNLPTLRSVLSSKVFNEDPTTKKFANEIKYLFENVLPLTTRVGFEAGPSSAAGQLWATLFCSDAAHMYLFKGEDLDKTIDWLDGQFKEMFKEINYPIEGLYAKK